MASAMDTARSVIEKRLDDNWNTTSIAWPGVPFDPGNDPWIRASILWGDGFPESRDTSQRNIVTGVLSVSLFKRPGTGLGTLYGYADTLRDLFQHQRLGSGNVLKFGAASGPDPTEPGRASQPDQSRWEQLTFTVPFTVEEAV